jgi:hypothetical protein
MVVYDEVVHTFMVSRRFLLRMGNVSEKNYRDNLNTHFLLSNVYENRAVFLNNVEKYGKARQAIVHNIIWLMRFPSWISKGTDSLTKNM